MCVISGCRDPGHYSRDLHILSEDLREGREGEGRRGREGGRVRKRRGSERERG